ncbi:MAG: T9SS type A sorting domain-containing protein [Bacteroidota bacterium]
MKKLFLILFVMFIVAQVATAQPTGPEVKWVCNVTYTHEAKFTKDGKYIVAIASTDGELIVIDSENGKILRRCKTGDGRYQIKLSKDDSLIYSCGANGIIYVHRFSNLEKVKEYKKVADTYGKSDMEYFDISKNDSIIICSYGNPNLIFYGITKDSIYNTILTGIYCRNIHFFDNDNKFVVSYEGTASIYDTKTFTILSHTYGHDFGKWVTNLDISPDNTKIVTCGTDEKIFVCDVETGKKIDEISYVTDGSEIYAIKFLNDGENILMGGDGIFGTAKLSIYNMSQKKFIYRNKAKGGILCIDINNNNNKYILGGGDGDSIYYYLIDADLLTSVQREQDKDSIIIYPNPVESIICIEINGNLLSNELNYSITSLSGKVAQTGNVYLDKNKIKLDVSGLQNGYYLLNLNLGNSTSTYNFIKGK